MTDEQFKEYKRITRLNNPNLILMSVKDASIVMNTSVSTVKKVIDKGNLDATTYGNKYMIISSDVYDLIENMKGRSLEDFI
nr:helix-turn-helix domain-containing protein [Clostridioides sp.]